MLPIDYGGDVFVAPAQPLDVSQPTELTTRGAKGAFVSGKLWRSASRPASRTRVRSLVREEGAAAYGEQAR